MIEHDLEMNSPFLLVSYDVRINDAAKRKASPFVDIPVSLQINMYMHHISSLIIFSTTRLKCK